MSKKIKIYESEWDLIQTNDPYGIVLGPKGYKYKTPNRVALGIILFLVVVGICIVTYFAKELL